MPLARRWLAMLARRSPSPRLSQMGHLPLPLPLPLRLRAIGLLSRRENNLRPRWPRRPIAATAVAEVYHRSASGKVTWVDAMTRDEIEAAIKRAPHEWHTAPRGFAPWPQLHAVQVVDLPSRRFFAATRL
jgi:hypothetical protein